MTPPLSLRPEARAEIDEAYRWYEEQRPGLGEEFLTAIRNILYLAQSGATVIVACFHASRDPRRWHERVDDRTR